MTILKQQNRVFAIAKRYPVSFDNPIAKKTSPEAAELKYDVFWGGGNRKLGKLPSPKVRFLGQIALDLTIWCPKAITNLKHGAQKL